jgi:hypothetical protein
LLIQTNVSSLHLSILNVDGDVVQDDDTDFICLADRLLRQVHTYIALEEEARHGISHITVGLAFMLLDNYQNHMFALVQKLGVWFLLDPATQDVTEEDGSTMIDKCGLRCLPGIGPSLWPRMCLPCWKGRKTSLLIETVQKL